MEEDFQKKAEEQILEYSKKIDFFTTEYTVEILAHKMATGEYFVPSYQRAFTWDIPRKSKFIESLIIGLPIPFVFFWQNNETGKLEIVDGSQRLRTIEEYFSGRLVLEGLERLATLNGSCFTQLPLSRQRKIQNKSIRGIILSETADIESRIDLFERINTGSKVANPAEVRRGVLRGPFMDFLVDLEKNEDFNRLAPVSKKQKNEREPEELAARFFAYSDGLENYKDNVSPFIFNYIKDMNDRFAGNPKLKDEYTIRFERMLHFVDESFEYGFRKTLGSKTTPRARFEAIAIGTHLALEENSKLKCSKKYTSEFLMSPDFNKEIRSDGANAVRRLRGRIGFVRDALLKGG